MWKGLYWREYSFTTYRIMLWPKWSHLVYYYDEIQIQAGEQCLHADLHTQAHCLMCVYAHTNKTACMHACTHVCMCIQGHLHMDKLIILLRVSLTFPLQSLFCPPMRWAESTDWWVYKVYLKNGLLWPIRSHNQQEQSIPAQRSGLINLRQVRW